MKILVLSAGTKNLEYQYSLTNKNKEIYCAKHGYDYLYVDLGEYRSGTHFVRQQLLLRMLPEYDYVLWMDCDAWFHNMDIKIEDIIEKYQGFSLYACRDDECYSNPKRWHDAFINSGVLLFKNDEHARNIIERWRTPLSYTKLWMRTISNLNDQPYLSIIILTDKYVQEHSKVVNPTELNKFVFMGYDDSTFIIHYPGTTERKENGVERWNNYAVPIIKIS